MDAAVSEAPSGAGDGPELLGESTEDGSGSHERVATTADWRWVTDDDGKQALLRAITSHGSCSLDLETGGLSHHDGIALYIIETGSKVYLLRDMPDWLPLVIADPDTPVRGFNLRFDLARMARARPDMLTLGARNIQDGYVKNLLVSRARGSGSHNLQATIRDRLGIELAKDVDHEQVDWFGELSQEMIDYAIEDVLLLPYLDTELDDLVAKRGEKRAWNIESRAVFPTAAMESNGFPIDVPRWEQLLVQWTGIAQEEYENLEREFPSVMNWNSWQQMRAALTQRYGYDPGGTSEEVLTMNLPEMPEAKHILRWKKATKRLSNWGNDGKEELQHFIHKICKHCGRIHPSWWQLSTMTGRYSCTKPNMQNIPRDPDIRAIFKAPPGYAFISCDYEQIEMLVAAYVAPDPKLLKLFREGLDTHKFVASLVLQKMVEEVSEDDRQTGKSANFGLLFGMGAPRFQIYCAVNYGVYMTIDEAQEIIDRYFAFFTGLYAMRQREFNRFNVPHLERAVVRNKVGGMRMLEGASKKATTALNTPIQGTAGYGIKASCGLIMDAGILPWFIGQVHDEMLCCAPIEQAPDVASTLEDCMVRGMRSVLGDPTAPVRTSIHIGPSWSKKETW